MRADDLETRPRPRVDARAWIAPSAVVVGDVRIGPEASVWYQCVLRGDIAPIEIGERTNIQDLSMVHVDVDRPCRVGADVGVGHRAILHACDVGDGCLIGMGAIVLSGATVGAGSVVAAGALVPEGTRIPPGSLVVGVPGRVVRTVDPELRRRMELTVEHYRLLSALHRAGRWSGPGADGGPSATGRRDAAPARGAGPEDGREGSGPP